MKNNIITLLKGLWIGGTMTVPGVSGGTMAMVLDVYDRVIGAVASFRKNVRKNLRFLLWFAAGGAVGFFVFAAYLLKPLTDAFPTQTQFFFIGAVAGGAPTILKSSGAKRASFKNVSCAMLGALFVLLIACIPQGIFAPQGGFTLTGALLQFVGGLLISIAFVLPGISVSQMLLMLGLYSGLLTAIRSFSLLPYIPLALGVLVGTVCVAKTMEYMIEKHHTVTYMVIFGFLIGSVPQLLPAQLPTGMNIPICILTCAAGFAFIFLLQRWVTKQEN